MASSALLSRRVEDFARRTATSVRLEDLYRWGKAGATDPSVRLRMARFLHEEIAIRNAQLCKELRLLPFGLAETRGVNEVVSCFSSYVDSLANSSRPETVEDQERFTELLGGILEDNLDVISSLGAGVREVREKMGREKYDEEIRSEVDLILDRFFIKRIGLRFLIEHHIESAKAKPNVSGIIHSNVNVGQIMRQAANAAITSCEQTYGVAPEVLVVGDGIDDRHGIAPGHYGSSLGSAEHPDEELQFTYVPTHLMFSCSVLLQNACFAVASLHADSSKKPPPVKAIYAHGEEEVTVKIQDTGGGIPRSDVHLAWSYFSSPGSSETQPGRGRRTNAKLSVGKDLRPMKGAGLPLARLHARYYGGDLLLKPIEGFGTDAYLFLNRLGRNCENLPHGVRVSPAMRDSSVGETEAFTLDSLGDINEQERVILKRRLQEFRAKRQERRLGSEEV